MSKDTAFNGETTPRHTFLCSQSQCLPPGDPRILCAKHGYPITGKSFIGVVNVVGVVSVVAVVGVVSVVAAAGVVGVLSVVGVVSQ